MFNLMVAGNVGKDAVLRRTQSGEPVLGFSVAVDQGKDKNGTKRDSVWVSCSVWGKRAESLERYITKGTKIVVTGRPGVDVYEGRGQLKLSVNELTFMGGGSDAGQGDGGQSQGGGFGGNDMDDEIPF
jgi:single-strand DNA-binding protein